MTGRLLQVHLSRHCNLACLHCYSSSGPKEKGEIAWPVDLYEQAAFLGYDVVSLSGGEPYLSRSLKPHVQAARRAGMQVNIVSNGMLIDDGWAEWTAANIGVVAISLDGPADLHDEIRGSKGAHLKALAGIRRLQRAGARCVVIHTVTRRSLPHLRLLAVELADMGIDALQLHPLEMAGRAAEAMQEDAGADLASRVAFLAQLIEAEAKIGIFLDVLSRADVELIVGTAPDGAYPDPLVIEPDGTVVPWTYGIARHLALGNAVESALTSLAEDYREHGYIAAHRHRLDVAARLLRAEAWPFVSWYEELAR